MYLPRGIAAEAGRYSIERTPYVAAIIDTAIDPSVDEVVFISAAQVGKSTAEEILLGFWADCDPGPCLIVKPNENSTQEYVRDRLRPLFESSTVLAARLSSAPEDNTLSLIRLNNSMQINFGWAGSPQSLASRAIRYVLMDECDKFPPFAGREADPISLAKERTATYQYRRKVYLTSTPTTRDGAIWRAWEACGDRRFYWVPCPHCGTFQRLIWPQVKWAKLPEADKVKLADNIEQNRLAWYECSTCKGRIDDRHKPRMLVKGEWRSDTGQQSKRVGFHLSALYSPWRSFGAMAAQFIRVDGDPGATMNFRNSWLAEPFEVVNKKFRPSAIRDKAAGAHPPLTIPEEAVALFASADTQTDHFYYVIRWWGHGYRSGLVTCGRAESFEQLRSWCLDTPFKTTSGIAVPMCLVMDSAGANQIAKDRTDQVYNFVKTDPARIIPTKGEREMNTAYRRSPQPNGVELYRINTNHFKDILASLIGDTEDPTRWMPHNAVDDDYCAQMSAEHKILDKKTGHFFWEPVSSGAANHYWDCEVLQVFMASAQNLGLQAPIVAQAAPEPARQPSRSGWLDGWQGGTPEGWLR